MAVSAGAPMRDVVLTLLHDASFAFVEPFLASLERTGYRGRVVVFSTRVDRDGLERLRGKGVLVIPFRNAARGQRNWLSRPWFLWRRIFAAGLSRSANERLAHLVFHLRYRRYLLYLEFLREHRHEYDRVFLSDCRDVYFQADPFSWKPETGVHVFAEDARVRIGDDRVNAGWIDHQFGAAVLQEMATMPIVCSGTTFGDIAGMIEYLTRMVALTMRAADLRDDDGDQGIHNYLVRKQPVSPMFVHDNRDGPVTTLGLVRSDDVRCNARGLVIDDDGDIVPVLHQYDRHPELCRRLIHSLES